MRPSERLETGVPGGRHDDRFQPRASVSQHVPPNGALRARSTSARSTRIRGTGGRACLRGHPKRRAGRSCGELIQFRR
jgi:hypothetical protein